MRVLPTLARRAIVGLALVAGASLAACDAKGKAGASDAGAGATRQAPPSTYQSLTGHFEFAVPAAWSTTVRIVEEPGVSAAGTWPGVAHAVHFLFQPTAPGAKSQSVLSVLVYDSATVARTPGAGVEAARGAARVYRVVLPTRNPFPAGADHDAFQALMPSLDAVKGALRPT
ncbi:MAG: hypothetical protein HY275_16695 [Gemmatimonadetes bacterium]|nr:hypothetical protein [Gemmatimonadota bacterium]